MEENDNRPGIIIFSIMFIALITLIGMTITMLPSCTATVTVVHTEGQATDVVDETPTNTVNPTLSIPIESVP